MVAIAAGVSVKSVQSRWLGRVCRQCTGSWSLVVFLKISTCAVGGGLDFRGIVNRTAGVGLRVGRGSRRTVSKWQRRTAVGSRGCLKTKQFVGRC